SLSSRCACSLFRSWMTRGRSSRCRVGTIHLSGCDVEGFRETAPGVIQEATQGTHVPIVAHGGVQECFALPRGEIEAPAKGIVEIGSVMPTATGCKCSVAIARHGKLK